MTTKEDLIIKLIDENKIQNQREHSSIHKQIQEIKEADIIIKIDSLKSFFKKTGIPVAGFMGLITMLNQMGVL